MTNAIVFITDDQGYGDLSCMGATDFRTPNLDRLADGGARFTNYYSNSPVCSPARAALLSGRYPAKAGVRSILAGHRTAAGMPNTVDTIPSVFSKADYFTAMSGKWHLGLAPGCRPHEHGFDKWFGHMAGCIDFFSHIFYWGAAGGQPITHDLWQDGEEIWRNGEYMTEMITDRAIDYIREARAADRPFVIYVAYNAPHYPMHAPQKYMDRFADLPWDRQVMAAMLSAVDDGVGAIMDECERQGVRDDTLTVFMSDNGPSREQRNWLDGNLDPYYGGTTGGLKGHKFSLYEGGIRVPGIINWPAKIPAHQVIDEPVAAIDILPTLGAAMGVSTEGLELDGQSLLPMVTGGPALPERSIYFEQGGQVAVRRGRWKLVLKGRLVEADEPNAEVWLSDLSIDRAETTNLADSEPAICAELTAAAQAWYADIETRWERDYCPDKQGTVSA
ncbi:MAG: sulfatase-like hydrolase/transferase [Planctomycetota bacterium]|jgi:arylsulfatase A-like enzyme|nr:sulfatase-like hydrolase/transferase [Planctomycetota bacterium]